MAAWYDAHAKFGKMNFEAEMQRLITQEARAIRARRGWRLNAVGHEDTHTHFPVSWHEFLPCDQVINQLKGALSHFLGQQIGPPGRKWFSRGCSKRRVHDQAPFNYLVETYLPSHSGIFWKEGDLLP